ncbi:hypothetical protein QBC46DRAFT_388958 [Diplogelasinospora grovesii]|uniref:Protein kinase domain-containing protein n=1 Tax=Diplogelasinospora grovesii TaxID=303347 RepID=A0AAN6S3G0_9PEZI|nr:hypothetical protein QBC46DRAFT_388958 [Diplogelasinospora grovesii]
MRDTLYSTSLVMAAILLSGWPMIFWRRGTSLSGLRVLERIRSMSIGSKTKLCGPLRRSPALSHTREPSASSILRRLSTKFLFSPCGPNLNVCGRGMLLDAHMSAVKYLLQALKALHAAGIVHRDLNPSAVMWEMHSLSHCDTATKYSYFG